MYISAIAGFILCMCALFSDNWASANVDASFATFSLISHKITYGPFMDVKDLDPSSEDISDEDKSDFRKFQLFVVSSNIIMFTSLVLRIPYMLKDLSCCLNQKLAEIFIAFLWIMSSGLMFIPVSKVTFGFGLEDMKETHGLGITTELEYKYGYALLLGWIGLILECLAGVMVILFNCCCCCCQKKDGRSTHRHKRGDVVSSL